MGKLNRRKFVRNATLAGAGAVIAPYILPSGRLFAATGARLADHVVFVLFGGGIRNQETVEQKYLQDQNINTAGNVMENILTGARPSTNLVYSPWNPILGTSLAAQGTLYQEMSYASGPTGHYNGHTVAMTGNYTETGLNLNINPINPTVFEYYRKHSNPTQSALNAWWISEGLGPYPSLNYSRDPDYGPLYGANFLQPATVFQNLGPKFLADASYYQTDEIERLEKVTHFLNTSFENQALQLPGIVNSRDDKERIKEFIINIINGTDPVEAPLPSGVPLTEYTGDLMNIALSWKVLDEFAPELTVINTFNLDICHSNFSQYLGFLHKADYGVGWLWDKIQSHPELKDNTVMICIPEHGRNATPNSLTDAFNLFAYDHTSDANSRRIFSTISGPSSVINQGTVVGSVGQPEGESIDIVPTIAKILGFYDDIPAGRLPGANFIKSTGMTARNLFNLGFLSVIIAVAFFACKEDRSYVPAEDPANPFDTVTYSTPIPNVPIDSQSFLGLHQYIFSTTCAVPGCHDGAFEPDFRTVQSAYNTLVLHRVEKKQCQ